jgi:guanylate kinase
MYELKDRELIFVFTGPDGSGRKTVADMVGATLGMKKVISYSTRECRAAETDGQDYHFISLEQFTQAEEQGEFLESVRIHKNKYGVKNKDVETMFQQNGCIYLILNRDGADILKDLYGDKVIRIFLYADRDTVTERQKERGLSEVSIERNLNHYYEDMAYQTDCEHSFENYDLAHTVFAITQTLEEYLQRNLLEKD